jgi:hypothetical protein
MRATRILKLPQQYMTKSRLSAASFSSYEWWRRVRMIAQSWIFEGWIVCWSQMPIRSHFSQKLQVISWAACTYQFWMSMPMLRVWFRLRGCLASSVERGLRRPVHVPRCGVLAHRVWRNETIASEVWPQELPRQKTPGDEERRQGFQSKEQQHLALFRYLWNFKI